jgi:hypothetical protein
VSGLPAASGIREGGACVGVFAAILLRPLCAGPASRPARARCAHGAGWPGRGARRVRRAGGIPAGCSAAHPAPGRKPARLRSRAPRPVPPSPARCGLGPGRAGCRAGVLGGVVLGWLLAVVFVPWWWPWLSVVVGCGVVAGWLVRPGCVGWRACALVLALGVWPSAVVVGV